MGLLDGGNIFGGLLSSSPEDDKRNALAGLLAPVTAPTVVRNALVDVLTNAPQWFGFASPPRSVSEGIQAAPQNALATLGMLPMGGPPKMPPAAAPQVAPQAAALAHALMAPPMGFPGYFAKQEEPAGPRSLGDGGPEPTLGTGESGRLGYNAPMPDTPQAAQMQQYVSAISDWAAQNGLRVKQEVDKGGSAYVTFYRPLRGGKEVTTGFKIRFADHPQYYGAAVSVDPVSGNTLDDALAVTQWHFSDRKSPAPMIGEATIDPGRASSFWGRKPYSPAR